MPDLAQFLKGFILNKGLKLDGYNLISIDGIHETIIKYRHYRYKLHLVFQAIQDDVNPEELGPLLQNYLTGEQIIHSRYDNPYKCYIEVITVLSEEKDRVEFEIIGYGNRV